MGHDIPKRFRAQAIERVAYYLTLIVEFMIQLELEFAERLDEERLARAVTLALDAEPVLGCRFAPRWCRPRWERLDEAQRGAFFVLAGGEAEYEEFKTSPIDSRCGPQFKACLWHAPDGDRLLLKVAHLVADGGGVKEVAAVVSDIYSRLAADPHYQPQPNLKGSRSVLQVFRRVPWHIYPRLCINYTRAMWANQVPQATYILPIKNGPRAPLTYICRHIPAERATRLTEYGRARGATLNDLAVAAIFRALVTVGEWDGSRRLRLWTSVDLRRYIPGGRGEAVCNLSAVEPVYMANGLGEDLDATLKRVAAFMKRRKASWIGLSDYVGLVPLISGMPYAWTMKLSRRMASFQLREGKCNLPNALTNTGAIVPEDVAFGGRPRAARVLVPPCYPPMLLVGLSGYDGTLTLTSGVYPSQREIAERFLDAILTELPK